MREDLEPEEQGPVRLDDRPAADAFTTLLAAGSTHARRRDPHGRPYMPTGPPPIKPPPTGALPTASFTVGSLTVRGPSATFCGVSPVRSRFSCCFSRRLAPTGLGLL